MNVLAIAASLALLGLSTFPTASRAEEGPAVAVLPLAAADPEMPYGLLPTASELIAMTARLRGGLRASRVPLAAKAPTDAALAAAGFDQTNPVRACVVVDCARRIGRATHARTVVVGAVTRAMAVIWGTQFSIVDVRSGKLLGALNVGYKGDVQAMERGEWDAGSCLARLLQHRAACPPDPGW